MQNRTYVAAAALGLMAFLGDARAEPLTTAGMGLASCEKLATDLKPEEGLRHFPNALIYFWVQGYMSAANITTRQ